MAGADLALPRRSRGRQTTAAAVAYDAALTAWCAARKVEANALVTRAEAGPRRLRHRLHDPGGDIACVDR